MRRTLARSLCFGRMHAVCDRSPLNDVPRSKAEEAATDLPYCYLVSPLDLVDWRIDEDGQFDWVVIRCDDVDTRAPGQQMRELLNRYTVIDRETFRIFREQDSDSLERTLVHVEKKFGHLLHGLEWLNMGGGHHITRPGYDLARLERCVRHIRETYQLEVILEPGEAVALHAGWLYATVLDVVESQGIQHAILDTSATAHMPDVLEMPYRPHILHSGLPGDKAHTYKLGGSTCLAGDRIGDYSFDQPLRRGDPLVFTDMAIYSMVKTSLFNGVTHPAIALWDAAGDGMRVTRRFGYAEFRDRLG
jgi:carboxynorspermidine decarboxylase